MNDFKYLNLIPRPLDKDQSEVCFSTKNAVVAAGAGSGKTQVLATRFAWLVMSLKIDVGEILTLTFTDKAASEMYQRIYDTLSFFANYRKGENPEKAEAEADLTEEKIALAKKALQTFSNSHIQTLDSYCGSVVRQCANRYGLTPDFSVASADSERNIKNEAFKFILKNKDSIAVQSFANPGKLQEFAENILAETVIKNTSIATQKGYFLKKLSKQRAEIAAVWNYLVKGEKSPGFEKMLESQFTPVLKYIDDAQNTLDAGGKKDDFSKAEYVASCQNLFDEAWNLQETEKISADEIESDLDSVLQKVQESEKLFALLSKTKSSGSAIADVKTVLCGKTKGGTAIKSLENDALFYLELCNAFINQYRAIKNLNGLLEEFTQQVNASKRRSGSLTFADVTSLALKILLENEDIRNQEKNAYKKIMIDEFQDNNGKNRDLLYLLSLKKGEFESENPKENFVIQTDDDNPASLHDQIVFRDSDGKIISDKRDSEKLFFVGDEKQSIYKFRGADVTVFNELTDLDAEKAENAQLSMTFNYRSDAELLTSFNLLFKNGNGIFENPDGEKKYEANYVKEAKKNGAELPALNSENVRVHFCFSSDKKISENENLVPEDRLNYLPQKEIDAYFVAKKIRQIYDEEKNLAETLISGDSENSAGSAKKIKKSEKIQWSDFAILDRSRSDRKILTKYLALFNIPFSVDQFGNIFEDAVVNDIYNFLRICVYPSDINAFAAFLCSPFSGLSENEAEIVLSHLVDIKFRSYDEEPFVFDPFKTEDVDENLKKELPEKSFKKFVSARDFFKSSQKTVLRQKITETLSMLWNVCGYKYETMLDSQKQLCAEHFDMIFELAREVDENEKSLAWFIDELEKLKSGGFGSDSDVDAKDVKYPLERESAVQIMTIHKSKGLQFKHVFVWGCANLRQKGESSLLFFDEENGISVKADGSGSNYFFEKQKELSRQKERAEFKRILYVAITRAVSDVYVLGEWKSGKNGVKPPEPGDFKLLESMVFKNYPDFQEDGFACGSPVFSSNNGECGFDYFSVPLLTYDDLQKKDEKTADELREKVISNLKNAEISENLVKTEICGIKKASPSRISDESELKDDGFYHSEKKDLYADLTEILKKYSKEDDASSKSAKSFAESEKNADELEAAEEEENFPQENGTDSSPQILLPERFSAADFGTLVHDYLNKMCLGIDIETYEPSAQLLKNLSDKDSQKIRGICIKMCRSFAETDFYRDFLDAKKNGRFAESELEFKFFDDESQTLYHGFIDLIFEASDGNYVILDYKTDQTILPYLHYLQQKCYRNAAKDLVPDTNTDAGGFKCFLYYLRFGESVEITEKL
ncbi:MAG: UvrD-helicase domain-containing protein [Treponema sp.]|nr:UvrD-helicase domain-containing protein [Treponema sp.]